MEKKSLKKLNSSLHQLFQYIPDNSGDCDLVHESQH